MTIGATLATRGSIAAVSHEVQPRFDAPVTVKRSIWICQRCRAISWTASIARAALFTIGNRSGQSASPDLRYAVERVGDERILSAVEQRLKRYLPHDRHGRVNRGRQAREDLCLARQFAGLRALVLRFPTTAVDEQQCLPRCRVDLRRTKHDQLMFPGNVPPRLRSEDHAGRNPRGLRVPSPPRATNSSCRVSPRTAPARHRPRRAV